MCVCVGGYVGVCVGWIGTAVYIIELLVRFTY